MTQAQKTAKDKFKKAIAYRTKTGVSLKEAFAHIYGKKVAAVKKKAAPKKKAATKKISGYKKVAKINVISGLQKIVGIPHKAKYYISYTTDNGIKKVEYFEKLPIERYKGMDKIIYLMRLTNSGTSLIPIKLTSTDKELKK